MKSSKIGIKPCVKTTKLCYNISDFRAVVKYDCLVNCPMSEPRPEIQEHCETYLVTFLLHRLQASLALLQFQADRLLLMLYLLTPLF